MTKEEMKEQIDEIMKDKDNWKKKKSKIVKEINKEEWEKRKNEQIEKFGKDKILTWD
jgi:hypothetical protein